MLYTDEEPEHSFEEVVTREGSSNDTVYLLPYQRAMLIIFVSFVRANPQVFFNDDFEGSIEEELTDVLDDISARLVDTI